MPISFDLEALRNENKCSVYLETGLYDPAEDISCKKALASEFRKVYTIELRDDFVMKAKTIFQKDIDNDRLTIIHGDSAKMSEYISGNSDFNEKCLFFLDAHVDNPGITQAYISLCPLMFELDAISKLPRNDNVICIDDVRVIRQAYPWGETRHGNVSYIDMLQQRILEINSNYKFRYMNGYIKNDILVAYV